MKMYNIQLHEKVIVFNWVRLGFFKLVKVVFPSFTKGAYLQVITAVNFTIARCIVHV